MRTISEQEIISLAPNGGAVMNGRKISSGGGFVSRMRSADDTFYMGECRGSGKSNYTVSADFVKEGAPVFRCSCPSRQFPCKHSIALLFEIASGKDFPVGEIPGDILDKRARQEAREEKKAKTLSQAQGGTESGGEKKKKTAAKSSGAAKTRKMKKQLEGLALLKKMTDQLLFSGLSSMGSISLKNYRELSKQLGDYYLPGPQKYLNELILCMEKYQKDSDPSHCRAAVKLLIRLHALGKKADVYLRERLEAGAAEEDGSILFEELGGIWRLDQLEELGLKKENAQLLQLSFSVLYDEAAREYIDEAFWADMDTGEVSVSRNYRPVRALSHIKQEDSCFAKLKVPSLIYYPGDMNRRIRWEKAIFQEVEDSDRRGLMELAWKDIPSAVKQVKNQIKNTLSDDFCGMLIAFSQIGRAGVDGEHVVMEDAAGGRIELRDRTCRGWEPCVQQLGLLPDRTLLKNQVMFGLLYYDETDRKICLHPRSIVTEKEIVRLMY